MPGPRRGSWSQAAAGTARDGPVHGAPPFLGPAWCFLRLSRCFGFHVTVKNSVLSGAEGATPRLRRFQPLSNRAAGTAEAGAGAGPEPGAEFHYTATRADSVICGPSPDAPKDRALDLPPGARTSGPKLGDISCCGLVYRCGLGAVSTRGLRASLCPVPSSYLLTPEARVTPRSAEVQVSF